MAYVFEETITQADWEKILEDAAYDVEKHDRLARADRAFSKRWAIDRERDGYLMFCPTEMLEEVMDPPYLAFVNGHMYRINRKGGVGNIFYFDERILPGEQELTLIQEEIRVAFAVFGWWGSGPVDKFGVEINVLVPRFIAKPKGAF